MVQVVRGMARMLQYPAYICFQLKNLTCTTVYRKGMVVISSINRDKCKYSSSLGMVVTRGT